MKNLPAKQIQPYPQEALNWEEGLTARDLSEALGVRLSNINKKIRETDWDIDPEWAPVHCLSSNESNGLDTILYVFSTLAAKSFIARYNNSVGGGYLRFLLKCEEAILNQVPKMQKIIDDQSKMLHIFECSKEGTNKPLRDYKVVIGKEVIITEGLFNKIEEVVYIRKNRRDLTPAEVIQYEFYRDARASVTKTSNNQKKLDNGLIKPEVNDQITLIEGKNDPRLLH